MSNLKNTVAMFTFSSKLWFNTSPKAVSKKDGYVSLYLQVYIGKKGINAKCCRGGVIKATNRFWQRARYHQQYQPMAQSD